MFLFWYEQNRHEKDDWDRSTIIKRRDLFSHRTKTLFGAVCALLCCCDVCGDLFAIISLHLQWSSCELESTAAGALYRPTLAQRAASILTRMRTWARFQHRREQQQKQQNETIAPQCDHDSSHFCLYGCRHHLFSSICGFALSRREAETEMYHSPCHGGAPCSPNWGKKKTSCSFYPVSAIAEETFLRSVSQMPIQKKWPQENELTYANEYHFNIFPQCSKLQPRRCGKNPLIQLWLPPNTCSAKFSMKMMAKANGIDASQKN